VVFFATRLTETSNPPMSARAGLTAKTATISGPPARTRSFGVTRCRTVLRYLVVSLAVQRFVLLRRVAWQEATGDVPSVLRAPFGG